jgi:hypothetical protein
VPAAASAIAAPPDPLAEPGPSRGWSADASPEALRVAFAYRGHTTLTLDDGSRAEGYVSNVGPSELRLWTRGSAQTREIPIARIRSVELSGRDMASP